MKNLFKIFLGILFLSAGIEIKPAPFDTGMITITQPNNVTFTGRIWGDEFIYWMETEEGYRFVETYEGWYYYATLDHNGEYTATNYKVGIDSPPSSSFKLERSQSRLNEIAEEIEQFNEQVELNKQWFAQKQAQASGQPVTLKVGVILIGFTDTLHYQGGNRPNGYLTADFDSMMFSNNYWYDTTGTTPHPENEKIFGSFRDYWHQMSRGKLRIEGRVTNPTDENGVPEWLVADSTKEYYYNLPLWNTTLVNEAITKALEDSLIDTTNTSSPNYFDKLVIVYATVARLGGALAVNGHRIGGKYIFLAEQSAERLYFSTDWSFTHIGIYAHEFAHNLGFPDEYVIESELETNFGNGTDIYNFCLMARGIYNGPLVKGECPATLSPYHRINRNWVSSITIVEDTNDFVVEYDYVNPKLYRINPVDATNGEHYIIESRDREGFDLYIPSDPADTVDQPGRLLVWHHDIDPYPYTTETDRILIKPADDTLNKTTQLNDFFPGTLNPNTQDLNDLTTPASTLGKIYIPVPLFSNERQAYFALDGIQKISNGNTLISEVRPNQITLLNEIAVNWQTVSVGAIVSDYSAASVFPTATLPVYGYVPGQGYVVRSTLENGPGYWVKFDSAKTLVQKGKLLDSVNIRVSSGWNLIGSISFGVPYLNICTEPPGIINTIYYYNGGYHYIEEDDTLKPSVGYWFKSNSNGNVILLRNFECPEGEGIDLAGMDKFIVTDSEGRTQELYVANVDIDTVITEIDRSLPPPVPEIDFDARFNYGEFIKAVSVDSGEVDLEIDVQTNAYPITLSWEINPANGIEYSFLSDSGLGKITFLTKKLTLDKNSNGKIKLFGKVGKSFNSNLPEKFQLYQNYPNPFNPVTTIKYDIVKAQDVNVIVYDILGRELARLVNEHQQPGSYEVEWNASNVSSGIYFYQLKTKNYINTKKMILLK
ncbi:MAG: T9SS type A sorting domain-containing protein [Ignavibacteriaceae bacterium]|nr:T9SS type A sorting domain-containing protein [Ignavibacteriaceae bacterium]